ncbi:hypothetical protein V5O48_003624 [Marasmius crinis-equi]|uniref:Uncharacterized protein n=1 Tax=Marasmius crinis-equi TaxID=585013 RepID=A0ABR3FSD1_9AGAR
MSRSSGILKTLLDIPHWEVEPHRRLFLGYHKGEDEDFWEEDNEDENKGDAGDEDDYTFFLRDSLIGLLSDPSRSGDFYIDAVHFRSFAVSRVLYFLAKELPGLQDRHWEIFGGVTLTPIIWDQWHQFCEDLTDPTEEVITALDILDLDLMYGVLMHGMTENVGHHFWRDDWLALINRFRGIAVWLQISVGLLEADVMPPAQYQTLRVLVSRTLAQALYSLDKNVGKAPVEAFDARICLRHPPIAAPVECSPGVYHVPTCYPFVTVIASLIHLLPSDLLSLAIILFGSNGLISSAHPPLLDPPDPLGPHMNYMVDPLRSLLPLLPRILLGILDQKPNREMGMLIRNIWRWLRSFPEEYKSGIACLTPPIRDPKDLSVLFSIRGVPRLLSEPDAIWQRWRERLVSMEVGSYSEGKSAPAAYVIAPAADRL